MEYVSEIYSTLLKRAQSSSDKREVWRIYRLIDDAKMLFKYLDKDSEVKRCKFKDGSYIDIEHFHCKDGRTSIRETNAFYPKLND